VIIGAAFGATITSAMKDVLMPPIGLALGGLQFKDPVYQLKRAELQRSRRPKQPALP
jgi:large conductance mechanosensitive channel